VLRRLRRPAGVAGTVVLAVAALWFAARGVDLATLSETFHGVRWEWIVAGAAANALQIIMFGVAWRIGLDEGGVGKIPLRHVVSATWIGKAGNAVLPARMGEVARVMVVRRHVDRQRGTIARIVGTLVGQRVLNSLATFIVVVLIATTVPLPVPLPELRWLAVGAVVALVATVLVASRFGLGGWARRRVPTRLRGVVESVIDGAGVLRARRPAARSLGMHVVAVVAQLATVGCLLHAFGVAAPATAPLLVVAMAALAGALPASPGGIGVTQAAIVVPLGATYDVSANLALAFALGLQATILVVAVIGGLVGLAHQRLARPNLAVIH
jgi:uncharacterized membrane protein YbhN (UPF0104 family)